MTLRFFDGFDSSDNSKWSGLFGGTAGGRRGTGAGNIFNASGSAVSLDWFGGAAEIIVGFAIKWSAAPATAVQLCALGDMTVWHVCCWYDPVAGNMKVSLGAAGSAGAVLATSSATPWVAGTYYYIELRAKISDTVGEVELRRDGASIASATGIDTKNGGTAGLNRVLLAGASTAGLIDMFFDDLYALDRLGSVNNNFLGDRRVTTIRPSAAGSSTQFTPSAGSNFAAVDETSSNGDTDYVESSTVGHIDLYTMSNLGFTPANIHGVQLIVDAKRTDAVARVIKPKIRHGGTNYDWQSNITLTDSYAKTLQMRETNPGTSAAFIASDIDALEAGFEVVS